MCFFLPRTDFSRIFIFEPPDFFADFVVSRVFPQFSGKKFQENPQGKSPAKSPKFMQPKSPAHFCRQARPQPLPLSPSSKRCGVGAGRKAGPGSKGGGGPRSWCSSACKWVKKAWEYHEPGTPRPLPSHFPIEVRREKRAQTLTFWVRRPHGRVGVFQAKGRWPKSSCPPSKICLPWVSKRGLWDVPGILPGCPRPQGLFKKFVQKSSCTFFVPSAGITKKAKVTRKVKKQQESSMMWAILSAPQKTSEVITSHDVLEPLKQVLLTYPVM